jgi:hypothetical protein
MSAFTAAVYQVTKDDEGPTHFRVRGTLSRSCACCVSGVLTVMLPTFSVFNAVVRNCLGVVFPSLQRILKLTRQKNEKEPMPSKGYGWKKLSPLVKRYMTNLVKVNQFFFMLD